MKTIAAAIALSVGTVSVFADGDTYRFEARAEYSSADLKTTGLENSLSSLGATGIYYFDSLPKSPDFPLGLTDFIERVGHVAINTTHASSELKGPGGSAETKTPFMGVELYLWSPERPYAFDLLYARGKSKADFKPVAGPALKFEDDGTLMTGRFRYYLAKSTLVGLTYEQVKFDGDSGSSKTTTTGLHAEHLLALGANYLGFEGNLAQKKDVAGDKNTIFDMTATFYPTKRFGVGLIYKGESGDIKSDTGTTTGLAAEWFVNNELAIIAAFEKFSAKEANVPVGSTINLIATVRF